jgi:hypothetical protein
LFRQLRGAPGIVLMQRRFFVFVEPLNGGLAGGARAG